MIYSNFLVNINKQFSFLQITLKLFFLYIKYDISNNISLFT